MRRLRSSRFLRVMALFAWVMLVAVSMPATAASTDGSAAYHAMPAAMGSMMGHSMQHAAAAGGHHDGCCGNPSHPACQCDAMCGSALPPALPAMSGAGIPAARYAMLRGIDAPTVDPIPPLRPPAT
ncbi:hypothetical protein ISN74_08985 [Dyella caseinilytica]|uniref:CopL family metal-binding regulatory protein n=2 Tax=Dyella caseinilytica TaxID=1849581 RepID=A0ABX7GY59_9GAMM|nr:hypothetical protein [Dyella caseinilytica]QRN55435.1 hypothetical protein ISN74_08985 [Dyella caseinilytica]